MNAAWCVGHINVHPAVLQVKSVSQEVGFERDAGWGLGSAAGGGVSTASFSIQTLLVSFDGSFQTRLQVRGRRDERPEGGRNTSNQYFWFGSFINYILTQFIFAKCFTCWTMRQMGFITDYNVVVSRSEYKCYHVTWTRLSAEGQDASDPWALPHGETGTLRGPSPERFHPGGKRWGGAAWQPLAEDLRVRKLSVYCFVTNISALLRVKVFSSSTVRSTADTTHAVPRLQPGPEPPWLGLPPGLPSAPLDSGDDSSPPSEEETHHIIMTSSDQDVNLSDQTDVSFFFKIRSLIFFTMTWFHQN